MPGTTPKYGLTTLLGTDLARDIDQHVTALANSVDSKMTGYSEGPLASRPTSTGGTPGIAGRIYRATDTGQRFQDHGTGWDELLTDAEHAALLGLTAAGSTRRGKSIIATEEARSNTEWGLLPTPDRVSGITLPADGLICVLYNATWKNSVVGGGAAAIFVGATQLVAPNVSLAAPQPQASVCQSSVADRYEKLTTRSSGLIAQAVNTAYGSDFTTGQAVGLGDTSRDGVCFIFAAAGSYDVSVRFKASSGSVTAKERKLWVWTIGF
jgi:hypothetical protein